MSNSFDMFKGMWSSHVPVDAETGSATLFADPRIDWLIFQLGSISDWQVLELGPLEAGHTAMLEEAGASVTAIEGNRAAFLRCLLVKNLFNLRAQFLLGDFAKSFGPSARYDLIVASGVLYHMTDPVKLLRRCSETSGTLFLWTHYYEPDYSLWHPNVKNLIGTKWRPDLESTDSTLRIPVRIVPQSYDEALKWDGFCGGPETYSRWVYRNDLLAALNVLGYDDIKISFDTPDHPNGPAFALLARRTER